MTENTNTAKDAAPPEKSKTRQFIKWIGISIGSIVLLIVFLIFLLYFILRTGSFTQSAVPRLQPYLSPLGVELKKIGSLRFDLLKSLALQDLELVWRDAVSGEVSLIVGSFSFEYSISDLFDQRAKISKLDLSDVYITTNLHLAETTSALPPKVEETSLSMQDIESIMINPPLNITIDEITFNNIHLDLMLNEPAGFLRYQGKISDTRMALNWEPSKLSGLLNFSVGTQGEKSQLAIGSLVDDDNREVILHPKFSANLHWQLDSRPEKWVLSNTFANINLQLTDIIYSQDNGSVLTTPVQLNSINFEISHVMISSLEPLRSVSGLESLFPLKFDSHISSNLTGLKIHDFRQQDMMLNSDVDHQLKVTVNGLLNPFSHIIPEFNVEMEESMSLTNILLKTPEMRLKTDKLIGEIKVKSKTIGQEENAPSLHVKIDTVFKGDVVRIEKFGKKESDPDVKISVIPEISLSGTAKFTTLDDPLNNLVARLAPSIILKNLSAQIKENKRLMHYEVQKSDFTIVADYVKNNLLLDTDVSLQKISIPEIKKVFSVDHHLKLKTDRALKRIDIDTNVILDKISLLTAQARLDNRKHDFRLEHDISFNLSPALVQYHDAAKELALIGESTVRLQGRSHLAHDAMNIQTANFSRLDKWPVETSGSLKLDQRKAPVSEDGIHLSEP